MSLHNLVSTMFSTDNISFGLKIKSDALTSFRRLFETTSQFLVLCFLKIWVHTSCGLHAPGQKLNVTIKRTMTLQRTVEWKETVRKGPTQKVGLRWDSEEFVQRVRDNFQGSINKRRRKIDPQMSKIYTVP